MYWHITLYILFGNLEAKSCCQITFTCSGASGNKQVFALSDKSQVGQTQGKVLVQPPFHREVYFFNGGLVSEGGLTDSPLYRTVSAVIPFT